MSRIKLRLPRIWTVRPAWRYGAAVLIVAVTTAVRLALIPLMGTIVPYNGPLIAAIIATLFLGFGPGVLALVLGDLAVEIFILYDLPWFSAGALFRLFISLSIGVFIVWIITAMRAATDALRRNENRMAADLEAMTGLRRKIADIPDSIQDDFYVLDRGWRFVYASRLFTSKVGKAPEDFVGRNIWELFPKHVGTEIYDNFRATMEKREVRRFEMRGRYTDSWYSMTAFPSAEGITVLGRDISDRMKAEDRMRSDLEALTLLHRLSGRMLHEGGIQPLLQDVMDAAVSIVAAEKGTLQLLEGETLRIVAQHGHRKPFLDFFAAAENCASVCGEATRRGERVVVRDVEESPIFAGTPSLAVLREAGVRAVQSTPLIERTGRLLGILTTQWAAPYDPDEHVLWRIDLLARQTADLIERTRAEAALRKSEERFRLALSNIPMSVAALDRDLRYTWVHHPLGGYDSGETVGEKIGFSLPPETAEEVGKRLSDVLVSGRPIQWETASRTKSGEPAFYISYAEPLKSDDGEIEGVYLVSLDITNRRKAEKEISYLAKFPEENPNPVLRIAADGTIAYANPSSGVLLGSWGRRTGQKIPADYPGVVEAALRDGKIREIESESGGRFYSLAFTPVAEAGYVNIYGRDITERKKAEALVQAFMEQERLKLGAAVEQSSDSVVMIDPDGRIQYVNSAFESINRIPRDRALGSSYFEILADAAVVDAIRESIGRTVTWRGRLTRAVAGGTPVDLDVTISPATGASGEVVGGLVTEKDVTQENVLQAQIRQAQKMEALGTLAGGITHDFNNILGSIIVNAELALFDIDPASPARRPLPLILQAANRGKDLVKQIITFSRQRAWERKPLEIAPVVREGIRFLRSTLAKDVTIEESIDAGSGIVLADSSHIHQILVNLCQNAALAMIDRPGRIEVGLRPVEIDADAAARVRDLKPGPYVRMTVEDNGCGMSKETVERIFDPFFTTRGHGQGSGLGLSVVQGIVGSYGGAIAVSSEPGQGSVFDIYIPRLEGESAAAEKAAPGRPLKGDERLLLVEDEDAQRSSLTEGLERLGYRVTPMPDGRSALAAFKKGPAAFDLVITDQIMPMMSGLALAAEVVKIRPDVPVILCTGFSERVDGGTVGRNGVRALVMKPFTLQEITREIRAALGTKNGRA